MEQRRRVLITNFHLGNGGGHRTYILSLLQGTLADSFELAVACPASSSINTLARQNGNRVFDLNFPGGLREFSPMLASVRGLDRIYRQFPFEIIHCNGSRDHWIALYWRTLYRRKAKIVRTRHAVKPIGRDLVHEWAFNRATDLNIYVSRLMVPLAEPPGKLKLKNAKVIPNGIDTAYFQPRGRDLELAAKLGIGGDDLVVGSNAGLGSHKRADLMLKAVASLPGRDRVKILLLGEERSAPNFLEWAKHMDLEKNVIYGGMQADVRPFLSLFDLGFILSEKIETSSFAAKEMMAMGIPLVCTRYSGLPENVDEGQNGFLIEPGNLSELQKCLTYFLNVPPVERMKLGVHSREKVVREFSRQTQLDSLQQAYLQTCAG
jgi:glycosyltransferase involved in cell wall biosynthesis